MPDHLTESQLAELTVAVYIEELTTDRRVLYVGDPESRGPERLAKVARSVDLVSPRGRVRGTRRGGRVRTRRWPNEDDGGRWDVVVVPDVSWAGLADDGRIEQVGAWLASGGVLVVGTRDPNGGKGLGYEAFYELLQDAFDSVRMIGQAPFRGFSLVDFAPPGELEVTFDGSLLEGAGESAERYLALCSSDDVVLDAYAIVQIPSSAMRAISEAGAPRATAEPSSSTVELEGRLREQQDALDAANVHAEGLERELEDARAALARAKSASERAAADASERAEADASEAVRDALRDEVSALEAKLAEVPAHEPAEESYDPEYARLESALRDSGLELTAARAELERRAILVRDIVEELAEASCAPAIPVAAELSASSVDATLDPSPDQLQRALQEQMRLAAARGVAAEAERAELQFELDEVRSAQAAAEQTREHDIEQIRRIEAALRGTVRGLNARLAEIIELYQLTQARLVLTEDDRTVARARAKELERDVVETSERLEFEIARASTRERAEALAHTLPPARASGDDATLAAREGKLMGALMRCQEQVTLVALQKRQAGMEVELAKEALLEAEERVEGMRYGYETRVVELVAELERTEGEAERALAQAGELLAKVDGLERTDARLRGELMGTQLRLADREEAVGALLKHMSARAGGETVGDVPHVEPTGSSRVVVVGRGSEVPSAAVDGAAELHEEVVRLRTEAEALRAQLEEDATGNGGRPDPRAMLGVRDAMIARLQTELAHAAETTCRLEAELESKATALSDRRTGEADAKVVAKVEEEEELRELEELTDRLEGSERERKGAHEALEAAREILRGLLEELPEGSSEIDLGALPTGAVDGARFSERLARLDVEAADREVLLRSMTAQLQERDDRIRALERWGDATDESDPDTLKVSLLELEERVARLRDELENERRARRRLEES